MTVVRFPKVYQETPLESEQLELWHDLPPLPEHPSFKELIYEIAANLENALFAIEDIVKLIERLDEERRR